MNVDDVVQSVKRQFGDETGAQIDSADIIRWINEGQLRISRRSESDNKQATISVPANSLFVNVPDDFFKAQDIRMTGSSGAPKIIQQLSMAQLKALYPSVPSDASGVTKFCSFTRLDGTWSINFAPKPSETVSLSLVYVHRPPVIASNSDPLSIPAEYHDNLVTFCLAMAKQLDGDMDAYNQLMSQFGVTLTDEAHDEKHKDAETYPFIRTSGGDY